MTALGSIGVNSAVADHAASFTQYGAAHGAAPPAPTQKAVLPAAQGSAFLNGWYGYNRLWSPAATATTVSGQVQENGTPVAGKIVYLYDHNSGALLGTAISDGSGNFSIPSLGRTKTFVVALDDPSFNALIFDSVIPL